MMDSWKLPKTLEVGGKEYQIRTNFDVILDILTAMNDPDIFELGMSEDEKQNEKVMTMLQILYIDFESIPFELYQEAAEKAVMFIDMGIRDDGRKKPHTMDWEQDAPIIIPALNRVLGTEVRAVEYMHWWTFLGAYMEIGESFFANVVSIRQKRANGKKLDKWEQEFYLENREVILLKKKLSKEELEEEAERKAIVDEVL